MYTAWIHERLVTNLFHHKELVPEIDILISFCTENKACFKITS